jgi:three-Cys-motif partner protein
MSTSQIRFGGPHTEKKLEAIEDYLTAYLQILSRTSLRTVYIDAFAGSGAIPQGYGGDLFPSLDDAEALGEGSAIRALKLERKFDQYIFIDSKRKKLNELEARIAREVRPKPNVTYIVGNAAEELVGLCTMLSRSNVRAVVFLDPFGSQVSWWTLEALAKTKHVDLWYLFPSGLCVNRQISSDGTFTLEQEGSLNRLFGPHDWKSRLLKKQQVVDLFGSREEFQKIANIDDITRYMIECLGTIFEGDVLKNWLPLGRGGAHWYSLIFAMANSSKSATKIGHRVAKHLMTRI